MSCISWNCCGLGPCATVRDLKALVARARPILIFLSEVGCSRKRIEELRHQMGCSNSFIVKGDNSGGGLALIRDSVAEVTLRSYNILHIDIDIMYSGLRWRFT